MPFVLLLLILEIMLIIHAVKTGRATPWAFIILFAPLVGAIAYVVAVLVPDWFGSPQGVSAQRRVANSLNPEKRYRALSDAVEIADTIANRAALGSVVIPGRRPASVSGTKASRCPGIGFWYRIRRGN